MSKRILLADDSLTIQKVVELTFMDEDFEVEAVGSGDEAINRLGGDLPSILIADVHMPGASGYEVCRQAKAMSTNLPVLLLVGTFEALDEGEMVACGADGNLKKPFDSQELLQVVRRMTSGEAPSRSAPPAADSIEGFEGTSHDLGSVEGVEPAVTGFDLGGAGVAAETGFSIDESVADFAAPAPQDSGAGFAAEDAVLAGDPEIAPVDLGNSADYRREASETPSGNETIFIEATPVSTPEPPEPHAAEESGEPVGVESTETASAAASAAESEPAPAHVGSTEESTEAAAGGLSDADVDRVARRVVEMMSKDAVREVAWDVIPDMAEIVIKDRIRELESETD